MSSFLAEEDKGKENLKKMAGLFACSKCHSRQPFEELSKEEHLCKICRKKYPLEACFYCRLEYHIFKKIDGHTVCPKCTHCLSQYGQPKHCKYCQAKAAFKSSCCARCMSSEKKYGPPVKCNKCKMNSAFAKGEEVKSKVGGQILCLQCTLEYKKNQYRQQKEQMKGQKYSSEFPSVIDPVVAPLKAENLAVSNKSRLELIEKSNRHNSRSNSPMRSAENSGDPTFGDHMSEITKLRDQIERLKKNIAQKEKTILEKDKKINEFQADQWEKDKSVRSRIQALQKDCNERIENLQAENFTLKRQVASLQKTKKTPKPDRSISRIRLEPHKFSPLLANKDVVASCDSATESDSGLPSERKTNAESTRLAIHTHNDADTKVGEVNKTVAKDKVAVILNETSSDVLGVGRTKGTKDNDVNNSGNSKSTVEYALARKESTSEDETNNVPDTVQGRSDASASDDNVENVEEVEKPIQSLDEVQEAEIKKVLKPDADDEYSSSEGEGGEFLRKQTLNKSKRKLSSALTVQGDDSEDESQHVRLNRKTAEKKRKRLSSDDGSDSETNNNTTKAVETKKRMPEKKPATHVKKGKRDHQRTSSVSSVSSDSDDSNNGD